MSKRQLSGQEVNEMDEQIDNDPSLLSADHSHARRALNNFHLFFSDYYDESSHVPTQAIGMEREKKMDSYRRLMDTRWSDEYDQIPEEGMSEKRFRSNLAELIQDVKAATKEAGYNYDEMRQARYRVYYPSEAGLDEDTLKQETDAFVRKEIDVYQVLRAKGYSHLDLTG